MLNYIPEGISVHDRLRKVTGIFLTTAKDYSLNSNKHLRCRFTKLINCSYHSKGMSVFGSEDMHKIRLGFLKNLAKPRLRKQTVALRMLPVLKVGKALNHT